MSGAVIGLVGPLPPPNGGMAMQTRQLAALLAQEGLEVSLLQTNAPYRPAVVGRLWGLRALFRLLPYLLRAWRLAGRATLIHLMANSGWSWQLFAAPVIWIGWLRRTPVIVNYRGGEARSYLASSARRVRPTLRRAARLVVPSGYLQEVFAEFGFASDVVPNIIDLDTFRPAPQARSDSVFSLVIARNLEPIYGLETAIRALARVREEIPAIRLSIAGSGPQLAQLQSLSRELGVDGQVVFTGRLDRAGIVELYHRADAMLNPTRVDNMPNSVLEALACGLPVISTRVGGVPYIVEDQRTALLVPPDDPVAMAAAIVQLYRDGELRERLARNGRQQVRQYGWDAVRQQWLSLYRHYGVVA